MNTCSKEWILYLIRTWSLNTSFFSFYLSNLNRKPLKAEQGGFGELVWNYLALLKRMPEHFLSSNFSIVSAIPKMLQTIIFLSQLAFFVSVCRIWLVKRYGYQMKNLKIYPFPIIWMNKGGWSGFIYHIAWSAIKPKA